MKEFEFERALLKKAANGDLSAFEEIILKYEKLIFSVAYRMLANTEDAKDVSQEAIIKIYKNIKKAPDVKSFKAWVCTIVTNASIDCIRQRKPTESLDGYQDNVLHYKNEFASDEHTPEETAIKNELMSELQKAIAKLPPEYKTMIILRDLNGFSYNELATITNCTLGTVKSRLSRARESLRKTIIKTHKNNLREED